MRPGAFRHPPPRLRIIGEHGDRLGERRRVVRFDQQAGRPDNVRQPAHATDDHRESGGETFGGGETARLFPARRHHEQVCATKQGRQCHPVDERFEANAGARRGHCLIGEPAQLVFIRRQRGIAGEPLAPHQQELEIATPEVLRGPNQHVGPLLGDHSAHEHDAQPRIRGDGCRALTIRRGCEPLAVDAVAYDPNPFGESPGERGPRAVGQRLADADDRRNGVEHATGVEARVGAQEVVVCVQHDPMLRVTQQPGENRGVVREHERGLSRADLLRDGRVVPCHSCAREAHPTPSKVDHALTSCRAVCTRVLDDGRAVVSWPHCRAVEHHELPKRRIGAHRRSGESVDHGRNRRSGAGREVVAGGDGVKYVGHERPAVLRMWPMLASAGVLNTTARSPVEHAIARSVGCAP
ncbi:hypothetical protein QFZ29_003348 [Agromyces albus]|nr:hypothetical protein [Agromyces albus]